MSVEIIKEKSNVVNQLSNKIYVSDKYEQQCGYLVKIYRQSGQVIADQNGILIKDGKGQNITWQLNIKDAMINTADSYIKYKMKFTFNCIGNYAGAGGYFAPQTNPETAGAVLVPGKYFVRDNMWWVKPAKYIKDSRVVTEFSDKEYCICQFPMNSTNIINQSQVVYGGKTMTDAEVCYETPLIQQQLSEEYQAAFNTQYFEQNVDNVLEFVNIPQTVDGNGVLTPGSWTLPLVHDGLYTYQYEFYKTFTIALNLVHSAFDNQNRFYIIPDARDDPLLRINLQPYSMAQLFMTEQYLDKASTGLCDIDLYLYIKKSLTINEVMEGHKQITRPYKKFSVDKLTLSGGYNNSSAYLNTGHTSTNDVFLCLSNPDENKQDSCKLKQRYTTMSSTQVCQYWNEQFSEYMFMFFNEFNLNRGQNTEKFFTEDVSDPIMFKHELLRSMGSLKSFDTSPSQSLNNIMKMMTKWQVLRINLEAFKNETIEGVDPIYDGLSCVFQKIMCKFNFRIFNLHTNETYQINDVKQGKQQIIAYKTCMGIDSPANVIEVKAFQQYDQIYSMNIQNKTVQDCEEL